MVRGVEGNEMATPKSASLKKSNSIKTDRSQKSILGFFQKKAAGSAASSPASAAVKAEASNGTPKRPMDMTPAPSSDAIQPSSPLGNRTVNGVKDEKNKENGLPSPVSSEEACADMGFLKEGVDMKTYTSPTRKSKRTVNYAESDSEKEVLRPSSGNTNRGGAKRRRVTIEDSDDDFGATDAIDGNDDEDDDMDDFIVADDSDEEDGSSRKRNKKPPTSKKQKTKISSSPPPRPRIEDEDIVMDSTSTAQQWKFDPEAPVSNEPRKHQPHISKASSEKKGKPKVHITEPEKRYPWLAHVLDADRNPVGHPDYDPRTVFIPPMAWNKFSPFEKQYWEIKQKYWDTIVFFKKGKFYELYENDATVGHQEFDLKLTDRVNMRMVGVPEASLDHWANQFVAKGYKIARVDQMESALAKQMRERDGVVPAKKQKDDKIIRRELAAVLTSGTLVDGGMLQDDMSTYCAAVKEIETNGLPTFGIAFVDAATAQFHIAEFVDDISMTRFETFVAQTRPGELLLEKSCISAKALRILKNNTSPTTIWNYLKPVKEFWAADNTCREIDASEYFKDEDKEGADTWPAALREAREKELAMSAFGALVQYLRTLKIERELVSLGNIHWYDPIQKATNLVVDGQSLINLEIFANSFDGGVDGTLFQMLNRCVTPFGKRMLKQWVCHPLADARKINARLDAVDALNADSSVMDNFASSLAKIPDLERLLSRVHAGRCKPQDFLRVLEGFEQIEYTFSLLKQFGDGDGVLGQLISSMPDLSIHLKPWKGAFDRNLLRDSGVLVPEPGVESDFDESQENIDGILGDLHKLRNKWRKELNCSAIEFRDNGKEIYQLEVPVKVKGIPKHWDQMSATVKVKRFYFPELKALVRSLQEGQETHSQIVKEVSSRFYKRFDQEYSTWLAAVKVVAQLDCLISLAKASSSLGEPSCRPTFVDQERAFISFTELRHPCMVHTVSDFIPNDIVLGGTHPNVDLLTGANAAGKSTILRMTCIAVILAQIGLYLPATAATLTPIDRIMSRLGAADNILAAQSTFFVELAETRKILAEATPRSLVILDELGRGTSSYDGLSVAQAVLHHIAGRVGCLAVFATHYRSLAKEFAGHPEIAAKRMRIQVDEEERRVTFLYKLEDGVADGSFGMHCAAMCGIPAKVVEGAEVAAREWESTSRLKDGGNGDGTVEISLGLLSDVAWMLRDGVDGVGKRGLQTLVKAIEAL
ncbi:DNA mismatch repair protein muts [Eremomyces bilateralis CBS 781.70]|uniref:DNA mismatch repair protein n=1 Tax=Eremomyces bilateralis CBS 781.70 TaxID=1392243 RepID=A0A6G1GHL7_9PEZI|nr:DNA mismatch repair protein muts [Eremomyces bilateralis CBS 781.70]KAF1817391.1 DNA mismatch repair protein muts [Eremomyces bilateralis CBS 781.70]